MNLIKLLFTFLAGALLAGGAVYLYLNPKTHGGGKEESHGESESAARKGIVTLSVETQKLAGIAEAPIVNKTKNDAILAYGTLEEDPADSFTIRAPIAGTFIFAPAGNASSVPSVGDKLQIGDIGRLLPRLAPSDELELSSKIISLRAELSALESQVPSAKAALDRAKLLNADDKNVADRVVEEAAAKVKDLEARIDGVNLAVAAFVNYKNGVSGSLAVPLRCGEAGEIVEILIKSGESVEAGQAILRISSFQHLLARVAPRPGDHYDPHFESAECRPLGDESLLFKGRSVAAAATAGESFVPNLLLRCETKTLPLRPGLKIVASIPRGPARAGFAIPRSSVVRWMGADFVYIYISPTELERRRIVGLEHDGTDEWAPSSDGVSVIKAGDKIVVAGAQLLLSEELKSPAAPGVEATASGGPSSREK